MLTTGEPLPSNALEAQSIEKSLRGEKQGKSRKRASDGR